MKFRSVVLFALSLSCASILAQEQKDGLWQKAVGFASAAKEAKIVPGTVSMDTVVKKKDGTVESSSAMKFLTVDKDGELDMQLVSAVEDGKDVTAEAKKQNEEEKKAAGQKKAGEGEGSVSVSIGDNPFDPAVQKSVKAFYRSDATLDGKAVSVFSFTEKSVDGKSVLKGRAWLDSATGMPLKVESTTDPLPEHVEKMTTTTTYSATPGGLWVPASCLIAGEAGFLWMHYSSETKVKFSDFRISAAKEK